MSKVITFSRVFPSTHPKKGEPTYFIEKIWECIGLPSKDYSFNLPDEYVIFLRADSSEIWSKSHTIRNGNRWKVGDKFSPRVWSGKPYCSIQIIIAPDIEIKKVFDIEIYPTSEVLINGKFFCSFGSENWHTLCKNDGLNPLDMRNWFSKLPFKGQIICWDNSINY